MVTVKQYAEKVGVAVSTIRQMCADGILPSCKIGVGYRIFEQEADEYFYQQWLDRKAALDEQKRQQAVRRPVERVKGSTYLEKLAELERRLCEA